MEKKRGPIVTILDFIFSCANAWNISNLASGSKGMLGLGRSAIGMPLQLSSSFAGIFSRNFAMCLPSSSNSNGVAFFGDSPYMFNTSYDTSKPIDVSTWFKHTRLYPNTRRPSPDYFVKVTSILVNQRPIAIDTTLLRGTEISTIVPCTTLERSIYQALVKAFDELLLVWWNVTKVAPVAPFTDCYATRNIPTLQGMGLYVPDITFVFENDLVSWGMSGANTMVEINRDVSCLGFLGGAEAPFSSTSVAVSSTSV